MKKQPLKGIALNRSHFSNALRRVSVLLEIVLLAAVLVLVWDRYYNDAMPVPIFRRGYYALTLFYGMLLFICLKALRGSGIGDTRLLDTVVSQSIAVLVANVAAYPLLSLLSYRLVEPLHLLLMTLVQLGVVLVWCFLFNRLFFYLFRPMEMVVLTDDPARCAMVSKMSRYWQRTHIAAVLSPREAAEDPDRVLSGCQAVLLDSTDRFRRGRLFDECYKRNLFLFVVPDLEDVMLHSAQTMNITDTPMLRTDSHRLTFYDCFVKRCEDVLLSSLGLLLTLPLTALISLILLCAQGRPVFFRQERLTRGGRSFELVKFRTMVNDAEKDGQRLATVNDDRITPAGRILRRTRLDELPQLWNVLKGDMSLVGPRPECPALTEEIEKDLPAFRYRLKVKAGITGMAQVYGNYATSPRDKLLMDVMYIEEFTPSLDLKILLLTLRALFFPEKTEGVEPEVDR